MSTGNILGSRPPFGMGRMGSAIAIPQMLAKCGVDVSCFFATHGLDPQTFANRDNLIFYRHLADVLEACIAETNIDHFSMLVGGMASPGSIGMLGQFMLGAPTLREALNALCETISYHQ